eukprot:snap_masked-scaffold_6-processed-gene-2.4-mRNA-1 protein AED:1.00 eAED:1.00 QI:0/-1/0/0/-1/1/1/0/563
MSTMSWSEYMSTELPPVDIWLFLYAYILFHVLTLAKNLSHFIFNYVKLAWLWKSLPGSINPYYFVKRVLFITKPYELQREIYAQTPKADFIKVPYGPGMEIFVCSQEAYDFLFFQKEVLVDGPDPEKYVPFQVFGEFFGKRGVPQIRSTERFPREFRYWKKQVDLFKIITPRITELRPGQHLFDSIWKETNSEMDFLFEETKKDLIADSEHRYNIHISLRRLVHKNMGNLLFGDIFILLEKKYPKFNITSFFFETQETMVQVTGWRIIFGFIASLFPFPLNKGIDFVSKYIGPFNTKYENYKKKLLKYTNCAIQAARRSDPSRLDKNSDLTSVFLRETMWDDDLLRGLYGLLFGTTFSAHALLSWILYHLACDEMMQKKLYKELVDAMKNRNVTILQELTGNDIGKLPYLNGIICEAARLYPTTSEVLVQASADLKFTDGTQFPKGTQFTFIPYAFRSVEENYGNPTEFRPERWINKGKSIPVPFGPKNMFRLRDRGCPGENFVRLQTLSYIASLVMKFELNIDDQDRLDIKKKMGIQLSMGNVTEKDSPELWVKMSPRKQSL